MLPTSFENANFVFTAPKGMTDCLDLPVFRGHDDEGTPCVISCWKFSKEDLEEIQKTGCIYLSIIGYVVPPVSMFTENPF
jgi:hypothetical protein